MERHFRVERALAKQLKNADRAERARLYGVLYDELFARVPDHPRLARRADVVRTAEMNRIKRRMVEPFLTPSSTVAEFGCGDGLFAYSLCPDVACVYGIDICDQRDPRAPQPANFEMIVYDGYDPPLADGSVDVAFSDQLIEHLHPEDVRLHFETIRRLLRPGGVYVLRTPHALCGPHDVSRYFCDQPEGFHLKEWTYGELMRLLMHLGYGRMRGYRFVKGRPLEVPLACLRGVERALRCLPSCGRRRMAARILPEVVLAAAVPGDCTRRTGSKRAARRDGADG